MAEEPVTAPDAWLRQLVEQARVEPEIDWIKERVGCSLTHTWIALTERIRADIARWRELSESAFAVEVTGDANVVTITRRKDYFSRFASLRRVEGRIQLRRGESHDASAVEELLLTPVLNDRGQCRLQLDSRQLAVWQVSRLILEPILF